MKNIKGYYSWIHSLNQAANKVQTNQQNLLTETTKATSSIGDASGKSTKVRVSRERGGVLPGTFGSMSDEEQAANIGMGIVNLIRTVNTGIRPDAKKTTEAPNPSLKPSEQIRLTPKGVGNIMGAARAISRAEKGTGETIFGDESFEKVSPDTTTGGPQASPENIATYREIRRSQSSPDLAVSDTDGDGDKDVTDVGNANAHHHKVTLGNPKFTNPLAAQARIDAGNPAQGDDELVAKGKIPTPVSTMASIAPQMPVEEPAEEPAEEPEETTPVPQRSVPSSPTVKKTPIKSAVKGLTPDAEGRATLGGGARVRVVTRPKTTNESVSQKISKFLGY